MCIILNCNKLFLRNIKHTGNILFGVYVQTRYKIFKKNTATQKVLDNIDRMMRNNYNLKIYTGKYSNIYQVSYSISISFSDVLSGL